MGTDQDAGTGDRVVGQMPGVEEQEDESCEGEPQWDGGRGAGFVKIFELEQAWVGIGTGRHQITPIARLL